MEIEYMHATHSQHVSPVITRRNNYITDIREEIILCAPERKMNYSWNNYNHDNWNIFFQTSAHKNQVMAKLTVSSIELCVRKVSFFLFTPPITHRCREEMLTTNVRN